MNPENKTARTLFKLAGTAAIIALILSISRLFLSSSDKASIEFFWNYDLANTAQMTAFLSVIGSSVILLLIGVMVNKSYDFIGVPLIAGSLATLIFITVLAYLTKALYVGFSDASRDNASDLVLTFTIGIEWLMLVIYTWFAYKDVPNLEKELPKNHLENQSPQQPPKSQNVDDDDFGNLS